MSAPLARLVLAVTERPWVRRLFEHAWGRAMALRFVAGETLDDAMAVAKDLNSAGISVSLDHLGEHVHDAALAEAARDDYLAALERIGATGIDANISVKLTQLGLGLDDELASRSLEALAVAARKAGTTVTIDMEESDYTAATLDLYAAAQARHGNLGVALQSALRRTPDDLARISTLGGHIRLCKGAYAEPAAVAYRADADIDSAFDMLLERLMGDEGVHVAVATHDSARIQLARQLAPLRRGGYEFQMLYGVRTPLQRELRAEGYPLRVYVPYGVNWYPYLTRRIAERPANLAFFARAVLARR